MNINADYIQVEKGGDKFAFIGYDFVILYRINCKGIVNLIEKKKEIGGKRTSCFFSLNVVVCAYYDSPFFECYNITDGSLIWREKISLHAQQVSVYSDNAFFSVSEEGVVYLVDVMTGVVFNKFKGVRRFFKINDEWEIRAGKKYEFFSCGKKTFSVIPQSFALMTSAFSGDSFALSEPKNGVRFVCSRTGLEQGKYFPGEDMITLSMDYDKELSAWVMIDRNIKNNGLSFVSIVDNDGNCQRKFKMVNPLGAAILVAEKAVIDCEGNQWDYMTGELKFKYEY